VSSPCSEVLRSLFYADSFSVSFFFHFLLLPTYSFFDKSALSAFNSFRTPTFLRVFSFLGLSISDLNTNISFRPTFVSPLNVFSDPPPLHPQVFCLLPVPVVMVLAQSASCIRALLFPLYHALFWSTFPDSRFAATASWSFPSSGYLELATLRPENFVFLRDASAASLLPGIGPSPRLFGSFWSFNFPARVRLFTRIALSLPLFDTPRVLADRPGPVLFFRPFLPRILIKFSPLAS